MLHAEARLAILVVKTRVEETAVPRSAVDEAVRVKRGQVSVRIKKTPVCLCNLIALAVLVNGLADGIITGIFEQWGNRAAATATDQQNAHAGERCA